MTGRAVVAAGLAILLGAATARATGGKADRAGGGWFDLGSRLGQVGQITVDFPIYEPQSVIAQIQKLERNPLIKGMILRVDSPGGDVGAVQEIVEELEKFRDGGKVRRPIVASFGGVAASGGYYIACTADRIFSNAGTLTGSIGVIIEFPVAEELMKKVGVKYVVIKSGRYKDTGNFARSMSPEELAMMQHTVDDVYEQFVSAVWKGRAGAVRAATARDRGRAGAKVTDREALAFLRDICDGRVMSGRQALARGLVDSLGGRDDARAELGRLCGLGRDPHVILPPRRRDTGFAWTDLLGGMLGLPAPAGLVGRNRPSLEYLLR